MVLATTGGEVGSTTEWRLEAGVDNGNRELPALSHRRRRDCADSRGGRRSRRFFKSDGPTSNLLKWQQLVMRMRWSCGRVASRL
uniref:Uncharacterized protein n=1 Tax=Oryza punctata TaxID=4537 RepID=A0A0E0KCL7_ORYPU